MKRTDPNRQLPIPAEHVKLAKPLGRTLFRLLSFVVCVAILVAAFAVSGIWTTFSAPMQTFFDGIFRRERITEREADEQQSSSPANENEKEEPTPQNAVPVVAKKLSEPNRTFSAQSGWKDEFVFEQTPVVFLYCRNPNEAYWEGAEAVTKEKIAESTFSNEESRTVSVVAKKLLEILNEKGITVLYGEPEKGEGYLGSTARAGVLIQTALAKYPQISLVIEIGRDSLFDEVGNYIKTVAGDPENPAAQVLALVGSEESGEACPAWQANLKLAEALQAAAEEEVAGIFRGIRVKSTPQNQQYAPRSLSLLIGSGANSVEEALQAASCIGTALSSFF